MTRINTLTRRTALALIFGTLMTATPARADDPYFNAGVNFYQKKDFKKALSYLFQAQRNNPYDPDCLYYQAMTYQQLGDNKKAVKIYATLISNYGYSNAGKLAGNILARLDPEYYHQLTKSATPAPRPAAAMPRGSATAGGGTGALSADFASLPAEARVPFYKENNMIFIDANVNNRSVKMLFDTGAESCTFGKNQLRELGVGEPTGAPTGQSMGVGSTGTLDNWRYPVTLKVGSIERRNFDLSVQSSLSGPPLLGQSFFRDFQYTIDKGSGENGTIHFVKRSAGGSAQSTANDRYAVPFQRSGRNLIVSVEVNGRAMTMFFDTGASGCTFTADQIKKIGLTIPEDATPETHTGVAGETQGFGFPVQRMKMGPIEKTNFPISVTSSANMPYPLLGQSFFGDWQYTIDNAASVIRFVRR